VKDEACLQCGTQMIAGREDWPYAGLPGIVLRGVEVYRCPSCGEYEVEIPRVTQLHQVLAAAIVAKRSGLVPQEARFLRNFLLWTEEDLAEHMGVVAEAVSRWETGGEPIGPVADRLLRILVASKLPDSLPPIATVAHISPEVTPLELGVRAESDGWRQAA
jgi:DNA-binding transcriptional regulator YiaG